MSETGKELQNITNYDNLTDIDKEIVRLKCENPAISLTKVAEITGYARPTISKHYNKPEVQAVLEEYHLTALQILLDSQASAANTLVELSESGNAADRIKAAKEILKGVLVEKTEEESNIKITFVNETMEDE